MNVLRFPDFNKAISLGSGFRSRSCTVMVMSLCSGERNGRNILVTGGAGYIGSHTCKCLASSGFLPVAYDDLSTGNRAAVRWGPLIEADIADTAKLCDAIDRYRISAVMHFAASAYVGESIANPRKYFQNNLVNAISLLNSVLDRGIRQIVFSSTCAIYGVPQQLPISESHPQNPVNPYGESKLAVEKILRWYGEAYDLSWISLRYFNAAGADPAGEIGECHNPETHMIPRAILSTFPGQEPLGIFGSDYPTPDGTAIRDFVHVTDLAKAHVLALESLRSGQKNVALNLGAGRGHSVREIIAAVEQITKKTPPTLEVGRRTGDPAILVADASLARQKLCWTPQHSDLPEIVRTAWRWFEKQVKTSVPTQHEMSEAAVRV